MSPSLTSKLSTQYAGLLKYIFYIKNVMSENSNFGSDLFLKKSWKIINSYDVTVNY